jgi:phage-related protein (TIGR01555 family)
METDNFIQQLQQATSVSRVDGWSNIYTGLGTSRDKRTATTFQPGVILNDELLESLYNDNDMAARIVETLPEESLRKGFSVKITDDEDPEKASEVEGEIQSALDELETLEKFADAYVWARLYGGSGILVGANDGASAEQLIEPLNEEGIKSIEFLNVIEKPYLTPKELYADPTEAKFGKPKLYEITNDTLDTQTGAGAQMLIHESRLIIFDGTRASRQKKQQNDGWGMSVLQRVHEVLQDFGVGWQAVGHLLTDGSQGVYKIKGLIEAIASETSSSISTRMQMVDMMRSVCRMILTDKDGEEFERQAYNFGGVDAILDKFMLRLSAAARMPVTKLMGQSPAGMNATGEGDFQAWYSEITASQEIYLTPKLKRVVELLTLAKDGPTKGKVPETWNIIWEEPWVLTPLENAELKKKTAETDKIYIDSGVVLPEEVTISRFRPDGYSTETTVNVDLREEMLEIETKQATEDLENPPESPVAPVPPDPNANPVPPDNAAQSFTNANADSGEDPLFYGFNYVPGQDEKIDSDTPEQNAAKDFVSNGIKAGTIKKPANCSSCKTTVDSFHLNAHHPDHSKPDKFDWLCTHCHKTAHDKAKKG